LLKVVASDSESYQRVVEGLLAREVGIDRYFTYIVTTTVKDETVFPINALLDDAAQAEESAVTAAADGEPRRAS
jgi:Lrp/AsnC family transcriptional regulator of ectoine degradation